MLGVSRNGGVLTVELQRPDRRNALNIELIDQLRATVEEVANGEPRASDGDDAPTPAGLQGRLIRRSPAVRSAGPTS